jgi:hypothetical protein
MRTRLIPLFALSLLCAFTPRPLFAQAPRREDPGVTAKKERARTLATEGYDLLQSGETERAITLFLEAEKLYHAPTLVLLLAEAHEKLGKIVEARALYKTVLDEELPKSAPFEFVEAKASAQRALDALEGRFGTLQVLVPGADPGDVTVTIDGKRATPFDGLHPQNPGTHKVTVTGGGGAQVTQTVVLRAGSTERLIVPFAAINPYGSGSLFAPAAVAFGLGVAGIGVGTITGIMAASKVSAASARCETGPCVSAEETRGAEGLITASAVSFTLGGAGLATSAVLLYLGRRVSSTDEIKVGDGDGKVTARAAVGPAGVFVTGTF